MAINRGSVEPGEASKPGMLAGPVALLWDIENCCVPSDVNAEDVAGNIRMALSLHPSVQGFVSTFSAYGDFNRFPRRLREGCQRTGINLIDVPNEGKDASDKAILVDMFLFALDNPPPSTIFLISGDVDFAPALHKLGQRGYMVVLAVPAGVSVSSTLCNAARFVWDWPSVARGDGFLPANSFSTEHQLLRSTATTSLNVTSGQCSSQKETSNSLMDTASAISLVYLKFQIVKLLEKNGGKLLLSLIPSEYSKLFGKPLCLAEYGCSKLIHLVEKMSDILYIKGSRSEIYLKECFKKVIHVSATQETMGQKDACNVGNLKKKMKDAVLQGAKSSKLVPKDGKGSCEPWREFPVSNQQDNSENVNMEKQMDPASAGSLVQLKLQLVQLLEAKGGKLMLGQIPSEYSKLFGIPLCFTEYGCSKLICLIGKMSDVLVLKGEVSSREVYLNECLKKTVHPSVTQKPRGREIYLKDCWKKVSHVSVLQKTRGQQDACNIGNNLKNSTKDAVLQGTKSNQLLPKDAKASYERILIWQKFQVSDQQDVSKNVNLEEQGQTVEEYADAQECGAAVRSEVSNALMDPAAAGSLVQLKLQIVKLLQTNGGKLMLSEIPSQYSKLFGKPLCIAEYGCSKLIRLVEQMSDTLSVKGGVSNREIFLKECLKEVIHSSVTQKTSNKEDACNVGNNLKYRMKDAVLQDTKNGKLLPKHAECSYECSLIRQEPQVSNQQNHSENVNIKVEQGEETVEEYADAQECGAAVRCCSKVGNVGRFNGPCVCQISDPIEASNC